MIDIDYKILNEWKKTTIDLLNSIESDNINIEIYNNKSGNVRKAKIKIDNTYIF